MMDLDEAKRWIAQAAADLRVAQDNISMHPYASCFFSQQASEKAAAARSIAESGAIPAARGIAAAFRAAPPLRRLIAEEDAGWLDAFQTAALYPDAWPGGIPAERFFPEQDQEAFQRASNIVGVCARLVVEFERAAGEAHRDAAP